MVSLNESTNVVFKFGFLSVIERKYLIRYASTDMQFVIMRLPSILY